MSQSVGPSAATAGALMDGIYRHQRHFYDLTRKFFLLGRDHLIAQLQPGPGATVLELGCGTGRNLIAAARRYPEARFYGVDISEEMLKTARANIERAGLADRILLGAGDASAVDTETVFGVARFDRVFFSYSLSMIPPWREALRHGAALVAPGGTLSVVDFGDQRRLPGWFGSLLRAWLARFHVDPRTDMPEVLAGLPGHTAGTGALYRGFAWYGRVVSLAP